MKDVLNKNNERERLYLTVFSAIKGDVESQALLGSMYYYGNGVERDHTEAEKWLSLAADRGNIGSKVLLNTITDRTDR